MERRRSLGEYRAIDLAIWAVLLGVFEFIIVGAANWWFPGQHYTVSLAGAIAAIVYMRWGYWGCLHAALAGLVFSYFSGGDGRQMLIYAVGNLASLAPAVWLMALGKEKVRTGYYLSLIFPLVVLLSMQAGRALMALALGAAPKEAIDFFTTDSLSLLFTFVIIWIARKLDGVYEDQKHYLLRLQAKEEQKGGKL